MWLGLFWGVMLAFLTCCGNLNIQRTIWGLVPTPATSLALPPKVHRSPGKDSPGTAALSLPASPGGGILLQGIQSCSPSSWSENQNSSPTVNSQNPEGWQPGTQQKLLPHPKFYQLGSLQCTGFQSLCRGEQRRNIVTAFGHQPTGRWSRLEKMKHQAWLHVVTVHISSASQATPVLFKQDVCISYAYETCKEALRKRNTADKAHITGFGLSRRNTPKTRKAFPTLAIWGYKLGKTQTHSYIQRYTAIYAALGIWFFKCH